MFPLVVDLSGRRAVVIGAGVVGARRAHQLVNEGAKVTVIAREVLEVLPENLDELQVREYHHGDLAGAFIVISATGDPTVNDAVVAEADENNCWLNVVDDATRSNFYFTAVHRDGDVIVSISTTGSSPALAQWIRDHVRDLLPVGLARVADALRGERQALHNSGKSTEEHPWRDRVEVLVATLTTKGER